MTKTHLISLCVILLFLTACTAEPPKQKNSSQQSGPKGAAAKLTVEEYDALSAEQQYQVSNKLMATFFKGVPASEFFDFTAGIDTLEVSGGVDYVKAVESALGKKLENPSAYLARVADRNNFTETRQTTAESIAIIREYPLSKNMFEAWMAYTLANTILFSPAEEIDSADFIDAQRVYAKLVDRMAAGEGMRDIVYKHMVSQENWRRFRSPEDNTREMIEIYLGLFDRDADVPLAALACKNWYLTGENEGYELVVALDENTEPQRVLDTWVTTCFDFYRTVADHPLLIPRVITVLVDHFFPEDSSTLRAELVQSIANTNPTTFHEIFKAIVLSKEYLINNERPMSLEEAFFNVADRIRWKPWASFYNSLTNPSMSSNFPTLHLLKQPNMSLKLGRFSAQPLDSLSFAYYHQLVRQYLLLDLKSSAFNVNDGGWSPQLMEEGDFLIEDEYLQYLFISVLGRKANQTELDALNAVIVERGYEENRLGQTMLVFDYMSRLPEVYYLQAVQ